VHIHAGMLYHHHFKSIMLTDPHTAAITAIVHYRLSHQCSSSNLPTCAWLLCGFCKRIGRGLDAAYSCGCLLELTASWHLSHSCEAGPWSRWSSANLQRYCCNPIRQANTVGRCLWVVCYVSSAALSAKLQWHAYCKWISNARHFKILQHECFWALVLRTRTC
jgi:hypothetical protein